MIVEEGPWRRAWRSVGLTLAAILFIVGLIYRETVIARRFAEISARKSTFVANHSAP